MKNMLWGESQPCDLLNNIFINSLSVSSVSNKADDADAVYLSVYLFCFVTTDFSC